MRLPIQAQPVMRNVAAMIDSNGILPSWPPKIDWPPKINWCKARCDAKAAAMEAACDAGTSGTGLAACRVAASLWLKKCRDDC